MSIKQHTLILGVESLLEILRNKVLPVSEVNSKYGCWTFSGRSEWTLVPRYRRENHLTAITETWFLLGRSCPTTGWSLCLLFNKKQKKKKTSSVELQTEASKLQLSSFMKKLWILSPVTRVRRMAVNLTWNSVDSDLPLGKTFRVSFKVVLYRDCVQWQEIASH